ncbi:DUF4870 domain-containing protein [Angustibacter sp. McL0619]|uniref:DUF4870 domain-containing protein n=1 Tax=Angustibacter sp. McL0619 TaxID=3415676 RepID=UPI003CF483A0
MSQTPNDQPNQPPPLPGYGPPNQVGPYPPAPYAGPYGRPYPGQPMNPSDERTWATLAHLSPWAGGLVGFPVLGPLVVYLIYKDRSPFVRRHAAAALNFQIMLLIVSVVAVVGGLVLAIVTLGFGLIILVPFLLLLLVASIVLQIMGAVAANKGQEFRYPLTPDLVH